MPCRDQRPLFQVYDVGRTCHNHSNVGCTGTVDERTHLSLGSLGRSVPIEHSKFLKVSRLSRLSSHVACSNSAARFSFRKQLAEKVFLNRVRMGQLNPCVAPSQSFLICSLVSSQLCGILLAHLTRHSKIIPLLVYIAFSSLEVGGSRYAAEHTLVRSGRKTLSGYNAHAMAERRL